MHNTMQIIYLPANPTGDVFYTKAMLCACWRPIPKTNSTIMTHALTYTHSTLSEITWMFV